MTDAAKTIHEQVIYEGVEPESDEYYNEIDLRMRSYFPGRFEGDQEAAEEKAKPQQKLHQQEELMLRQAEREK